MLVQAIEERIAYLSNLTKNIKRYLKRAPSGYLYFNRSKGHTYCGVRTKRSDGRYKTKFIDPENTPLLTTYYDKALCKAILPALEAELKELESINTKKLRAGDSVFMEESLRYEAHASSEFLHYSVAAKLWAEESFSANSLPIDAQRQYTTITGIIVRSKIEKIIADCLTRLGYYYRYEMQVVLKNGESRYPDFVVFSPYTGRLLWIEVFGLMDDSDYAVKAIRKMKEYGSIGILPGINFLAVYDLQEIPFNEEGFVRSLEHMLRNN